MKHDGSIIISEFTNPSGEIVYRVSGWLDGRRIRKNYATRGEAEVERDLLEIKTAQGDTGLRKTITRLTDE